jgi:hypothetical protein
MPRQRTGRPRGRPRIRPRRPPRAHPFFEYSATLCHGSTAWALAPDGTLTRMIGDIPDIAQPAEAHDQQPAMPAVTAPGVYWDIYLSELRLVFGQ